MILLPSDYKSFVLAPSYAAFSLFSFEVDTLTDRLCRRGANHQECQGDEKAGGHYIHLARCKGMKLFG